MNTRTAPRVVVVGAGLSGLTAALYLRGSGCEVTVLERDAAPGGRVSTAHGRTPDGIDYEFDTGASVLTMPGLIDDAFAAVGAAPDYDTLPVSPAYRMQYPDGSAIRVFSDPQAMSAEIAHTCGEQHVVEYLRLRRWLSDVYDHEFEPFMNSNFDGLSHFLTHGPTRRALIDLIQLGAFNKLGPTVARYITEPRLQRVFTFQSLYAGLSPATATGIYGAIAHMDTSLGVSFPRGGMGAIARSMVTALTNAGAAISLNRSAESIEIADGTATAVITDDGDVLHCDAVILTADTPGTDTLLGQWAPRHRRKTRYSPSAVVVHGLVPETTARGWSQAHHTLSFGHAWDETFRDLAGPHAQLMRDPSMLITQPSRTDPAVAPGSWHPVSVLAPCPNIEDAPLDWSTRNVSYVQEVLATLESRNFPGIADLTITRVDHPGTWAAAGMTAGTPFSAAHTLGQTGPFRRKNTVDGLANVFLAGSSTVPGVGIPPAVISGRLAAVRAVAAI